MAEIPEAARGLLIVAPAYATLTTLPDGLSPPTVVWFDYDPDANRTFVNTERGRREERNDRDDPRAGILVVDPRAGTAGSRARSTR